MVTMCWQALTFRNLLDSEESDEKAITAMGILTNFETMMSVIESKEVSRMVVKYC